MHTKTNIIDFSEVNWQDTIHLLFILTCFGQGLFVHPVFPSQDQTLILFSPALFQPLDFTLSAGSRESLVMPCVPPCLLSPASQAMNPTPLCGESGKSVSNEHELALLCPEMYCCFCCQLGGILPPGILLCHGALLVCTEDKGCYLLSLL